MKTDFILRRIQSFFGIIPLYFFLIIHIPHTAVPFLTGNFIGHPILPIITMGIIPLLFHGLIGIYIIIHNTKSGHGSTRETRPQGILYILQRISAIIILLFAVSHVFLFRALRYSEGYTIYIISVVVFMLGIAACAFHIGYGTYTFFLTWGLCANQTARKIIRIASIILGITFEIVVTVLFIFVFISIKGMLGL